MALLMPDINLRRRRKHLERYWRKVLHEEHDKISLKGLVPVSVISVPRSEKSVRSHIIARSQVTEIVDDFESVPQEEPVGEPTPSPIAVIVKGALPLSSSRTKGYNSRSKRRSLKNVVSSQSSNHSTPPSSADNELPEKAPQSGASAISTSSMVSSAPRSNGKPKSNPKYITRVKGTERIDGCVCAAVFMRSLTPTFCRFAGQTLGTLIYRVHENEDNILELDFTYLAQRNRRLEAQGANLVARALTPNRTVVKLIMRDHNIGDAGALAIANMLRVNTTLEYIDLYGNNITDDGAEALANAIFGHESLTYLSMWSNQIGDRGAFALAEALKCNQALTYLGLVHNRISVTGGEALLQALDLNIRLETLNLAKNHLPENVIYKIRVALARNRYVCRCKISLTL
ncbi:Myosin-like protein, partial [Globisporangium splendens]